MNKLIKKALSVICAVITALINRGRCAIVNRTHKTMISILHLKNEKCLDFTKYDKWIRSFGFKPSKSDFVLFYPYLKHLNCGWKIVPTYVVHNYINPILNPIKYRGFYEDKNSFEKLIPTCFPHAILRRIGGGWYDSDYQMVTLSSDKDLYSVLDCCEKIIVKPSVESSSGHGIKIFLKSNNYWQSVSDDMVLTLDVLKNEWGANFIIQEVLKQSPFMSQFNPTSINTLRMVAYRSVVDNSVSLLWTIMRMGGKGSIVDNAHSGGVYVGVDNTGKLNDYVCNQYGEVFYEHNGLNFKETEFIVPEFDKIVEFVKDAANNIIHHRLIAFDIVIDENNEYKIIEFNIRGFSGWLGEFSGFLKFGDKAEEILEYCSQHKKLAEKVFYQIG